jgi:hypothetical protein
MHFLPWIDGDVIYVTVLRAPFRPETSSAESATAAGMH